MLWRRDGTGFYVRYSAGPLSGNGYAAGAVITFSDISVRRRIEEELRENKERLQVQNAALTELGRGRRTAALDVDAALREAAGTACEALGTDRVGIWLFNEDRSALACRVLYDRASRSLLSGPEFARAAYPAYFKLLEEERTLAMDDAAADFRAREFRESYTKPGKVGSLLDVSISSGEKTAGVIRAERGPGPRPWGLDEQNLLVAVADFAALAITGSERIKLENMKDFLTHTIVHDLKNPLSSIICAGQLLSEDLRAKVNRGQRETLDILNSMAEEMKSMVSNILDISRIEEGKLPLKTARFSPAKLLREAAGALKISAAHEGKRIKVSPPESMPEATGDIELLKRVMENLIANALKFAPAGTAVETGAETAADGKTPEFYVMDRGPGVPEEYRERIFEKFVQLEDPSPRKWGGKGLGLAFCKLAVEAHGGRIRVEAAPGGGSVFRFTLPALKTGPGK